MFVLGYWSYGEKKFGSGLVFFVTRNNRISIPALRRFELVM